MEVRLLKKIGTGYEDYKKFIDEDMYYIDKTMLINDIVEKGGAVTLFTRPRRFGKTLALSMLRTFFELEYDYDGNVIDKTRYFDGMNDGLVGEKSFKYCDDYILIDIANGKGLSHGDVIDLNRKNIENFDVREFYVKLVNDLKNKGF